MPKPMVELTTTRQAEAALAEPRPPRLIRVRRLQEYGGRAHYYLDGWPRPVPAWTRRFDGRTWRGVLFVAVLALAAMGTGVIWLLRLLGKAR